MSAARPTSAALRLAIEEQLAHRAPAALTPSLRSQQERNLCGIDSLDQALRGGIPVGAITELAGPEGSGRTSAAQAYVAACHRRGSVAAWVDTNDTFAPENAALAGIALDRLLWVRCGQAPAQTQELRTVVPAMCLETGPPHTTAPLGAGSPHPRSEGRGMAEAVHEFLQAQPRSSALRPHRRDKSIGTPGAPNRPIASLGNPRSPASCSSSYRSVDREEQIPTDRQPSRRSRQTLQAQPGRPAVQRLADRIQLTPPAPSRPSPKPPRKRSGTQNQKWTPVDQALRATDLLLQSGGFSVLVLDLGSVPAEISWRIPLATWFRFRAACDRTRTSLLLLTQHPCARSSASLVLSLQTGRLEADSSVVRGIAYNAAIERERFPLFASNVLPLRRPPQRHTPGAWKGHAAWAL